jgi:outer membrane protein W
MKFLSFLLLAGASAVGAQTLSYGVKGGGTFTDPAERSDQSKRYVVGPMAEIGFGSRLGIEFNALYSRFGSTLTGGAVRGHAVEFPALGKFYFADRSSSVRPYASSGFAFRNIWFENTRSNRVGSRNINSTEPAVGAVVGGGVAFKTWILKLTPEVRYTRWGGFNYPATNPNQLQALVGISF